MSETEDFLQSILPRLIEADTALHNGDEGPRMDMWSHGDPVTLFGAVLSARGWREIAPVFERLGSQFSHCESFDYEVTAAGASGDLAYIAGIEHTKASVGGAAPDAYELRVTTIFRREDDEWKVVHRHADPLPGSAARTQAQLARIGEEPHTS
jgi:ketosteroid isomerase-like protein